MRPQWNLKEIRQMYGLSQSDIAEAIGVKSRSTIVAIESGDRDLTSEELGRLADHLGVEIADLIAYEIPDYDKYREMLVETLRRYTELTGHGIPKTLYAKLIYFADFAWFYDQLKPAFKNQSNSFLLVFSNFLGSALNMAKASAKASVAFFFE